MTAHEEQIARCRAVLAGLRDKAEAATPGPWVPHVRSVTPEASHPHIGWVSTPGNTQTVVDNAWDGDVVYIASHDPAVRLAELVAWGLVLDDVEARLARHAQMGTSPNCKWCWPTMRQEAAWPCADHEGAVRVLAGVAAQLSAHGASVSSMGEQT